MILDDNTEFDRVLTAITLVMVVMMVMIAAQNKQHIAISKGFRSRCQEAKGVGCAILALAVEVCTLKPRLVKGGARSVPGHFSDPKHISGQPSEKKQPNHPRTPHKDVGNQKPKTSREQCVQIVPTPSGLISHPPLVLTLPL